MKTNEANTIYHGEVLWFDERRGYGFIECNSFPKPVWIHYSRIVSNEKFKTLSKGQLVTFEVADSKKGLMAVNVQENKVIKVEAKVVS